MRLPVYRTALAFLWPTAVASLIASCQLFYPLDGYDTNTSSDGGIPTSPTTCPADASSTLLCEGFEDGLPDGGSWGINLATQTEHSTVTTSTEHVHTGNSALRASIDCTQGDCDDSQLTALLSYSTDPNLLPSHLFVRLWVYAPVEKWVGKSTGANFVYMQELAGRGEALTVLLPQQSFALFDFVEDSAPDYPGPDGSFPSATWSCVEWELTSGVTKSASLGETTLDSLPETYTLSSAPDYKLFSVGMTMSPIPPTTVNYEVWIDDVYVGQVYVGC